MTVQNNPNYKRPKWVYVEHGPTDRLICKVHDIPCHVEQGIKRAGRRLTRVTQLSGHSCVIKVY